MFCLYFELCLRYEAVMLMSDDQREPETLYQARARPLLTLSSAVLRATLLLISL